MSRGLDKNKVRPVHLDVVESNLIFRRTKPKATWCVPPVITPLYWFDIVMLRKKLITAVHETLFVVDGRRFRVIAQDEKRIGVGYTRWLVYEELPIPGGGRP